MPALIAVVVALAAAPAYASGATLSASPGSGNTPGNPLSAALSSPVSGAGLASQQLSLGWDPTRAFLGGSVQAPAGWTTEYTTDGSSWSTSPPSDLSTVRGVRAGGSFASAGMASGVQLSDSGGTGPVTPPPVFSGGSGGDGWNAFASEDYVLAAYHHSGASYIPFTLACYLKSSGQACDGSGSPGPSTFTKSGPGTSSVSPGVVINDKAYVMVSQFEWLGYVSYTAGVQCVDVSSWPFSDCGYTRLYGAWSGGTIGGIFGGEPGTLSTVGSKIYAVTPSGTPAGLAITCFDTATGQACSGQPWLLSSSASSTLSYGTGFTTAVGNRLFVTAGKLWCFDLSNSSECSGSWPITGVNAAGGPGGTTSIMPLVPMRDSSGTPIGSCLLYNPPSSPRCLDFAGSTVAVPSGLSSLLSSMPVGGSVTMSNAQYDFDDYRQYWVAEQSGQSFPACYDWRTDAACSGFRTTDPMPGARYAVTVDRYDPNCVWTNGDSGGLSQFSAIAGGDSCQGGPRVDVPLDLVRTGCSAGSSPQAWRSLTVTAPGGLDRTRFKVTVRDSSGNAIPGYTNLSPDSSGSVNVSGLTTAQTGRSPTVAVVAAGATNSQAALVTADLEYETEAPELCVPLEVKASCPSLGPGVASSASVPLAPVTLTGSTSQTVGGSTSSDSPTADAGRAPMTGCLGTVDGRVTHADGKPAPNERVELLAPDGTVLATTQTDSAGRYEFANVHPEAGYRVRATGSNKNASVAAQQATTVNFEIPASRQVTVTSVSTTSSTAISTTVRVPGPGTLTQVGTSGGRTACRAETRRVTRARRLTVTCRLTEWTRAIRRERSVRVRLVTRFRGPSGTETVRRSLRLKATGPSFTG